MSKITPEDKIYYCKQYLAKAMTQRHIARVNNVSLSSVQEWIAKYESMGETAFLKKGNKRYSKELKLHAVQDYLAGIDSQLGICKKIWYSFSFTTI